MEHVTIHIETPSLDRLVECIRIAQSDKIGEILTKLTGMEASLEEIKTMDQATQDLLAKIDATTSKIGANVQIVADTDQKISDEIDALIAKINSGATPADVVASLQGLADRAQATSDALDAQVPILQAIAAKGAPVVPPPPPPPVV